MRTPEFPIFNSGEVILEYLDFMLRQYRLIDALWFLKIEEEFGRETAERINEEIWSEMGIRSAEEIKKRFKIGKGLKEFVRAFNLYPWSIIISHDVVLEDDRIIIRTPYCPPQESRKRQGLGEYKCKDMHMKELKNFAKIIDENLQVECKFAPPDDHPEDLWCEWEVKYRKE